MSQSILYFVLNVSDSIIFHLTCIFYCVVESTSKCKIIIFLHLLVDSTLPNIARYYKQRYLIVGNNTTQQAERMQDTDNGKQKQKLRFA